MASNYFEHSERFLRDLGIGSETPLNTAEKWLSTTQLLYREARQRGWETRRLGGGVIGFFDGSELITTSRGLSTAVVGANAEVIARSKSLSKALFSIAGLPVPRGNEFEASQMAEAWGFASGIAGNVVVKPSEGSKGKGVSTGITTQEQFCAAWSKAAGRRRQNVLVEEEVQGLDTRAFVVDQEVVGAVTRVPPFVVGDGSSTVSELLACSLEARSRNAYLQKFQVSVDDRILLTQGLDLETRVEDGQVVFLNGTNNVSQGGYSIDTVELLSDDFKRLAIDAVRAVPNLKIAGVDLIARNFKREDAYLIELNADAAIWLHHFPSYGQPRSVASRILDYQRSIFRDL